MAEKLQSRLLTKPIGSCRIHISDQGEGYVYTLAEGSDQWKLITNDDGMTFAVWTGYIDLQGMTVAQDKTFAAQSVAFQEGNCLAGEIITIWDMVTDVPVDWATELNNSDGIQNVMPAFLGSSVNSENVVFGNIRLFLPNANITGGILPAQSSVWGTNRATASDRLYIHRIVLATTTGTIATQHVIPPTVVAIPGLFFEEKELSHMERLRRSYVLQQ